MKLRAVWLICAAGMLALAGCTGDARGAATPTPDGPTPTITPALLLPVALTPIGQATTAGARPASSAATARPGTVVPTPFPAFQPSSAVSATVPILMYHQIRDLPANASADDLTWTVSPASLAAQLAYLSDRGYTTITLDQLLDGFSGQAPLPPKPVVITFDDGWKTQYTNALPLLKKYGQTATFYIVSSYMGYGAYFDWTMTTEVLRAGMTIGGHTVDHKSLTGLSATDLDHELRDSKALLDSKLGISVTHLAYPNGAFNDTVVAAARHAGYRSATTINPAPVKSPLVPLSLPRLRVSYKDTLADFIKKLP